jgi:hypothetical protein
MGKNPGDRLSEERHVKRLGDGQAQRIDQVMTGDASQSGKHFAGKIKIGLVKDRFLGVIRVARQHPQIVLEYKLKS